MAGKSFDGPLKGLRVIDAGQMIAAPLACTLLADFGAEARSNASIQLG